VEDNYKRDAELFRTEALKRDLDLEGEKDKCEREMAKHRSQVDAALDFILSLRKDLLKLLK